MFDERKNQLISQNEKITKHNVIIENRERTSISGVVDIDSFNESFAQLYTDMGTLVINGEDLHINKLNVETGELIVDGYVCSFEYSDKMKQSGGSLLKRIFK